MKPFSVLLIAAAMGTMAFAQTPADEHSEHHPDAKASSEAAQSPAPDMQQKMKDMQALMEKIEKTKDPSERRRLLAQHATAMREQMMSMTLMHCAEGMGQMGTGGMMGGGMGPPGAGGAGKPPSGHPMMQCHQMMQERMNLMMGMMEQMLRHEEARDGGHN